MILWLIWNLLLLSICVGGLIAAHVNELASQRRTKAIRAENERRCLLFDARYNAQWHPDRLTIEQQALLEAEELAPSEDAK